MRTTHFLIDSLAGVRPIVFVGLLLVGAVAFAIRANRGSRVQAARTTGLELAMAMWILLILAVTVVPQGDSSSRPPVAFIPFLDAIERVANHESYPSAEISDIVSNTLLFVPLGIGAALRWGRPWMIRAILFGAALSTCIEASQALEAVGRFASATDVVTNTTGTALGFAIGLRIRRAEEAMRVGDAVPGDGPTVGDRPPR